MNNQNTILFADDTTIIKKGENNMTFESEIKMT